MRKLAAVPAALAVLVAVSIAATGGRPAAAGTERAAARAPWLAPFSFCGDYLEYVKRHFLPVATPPATTGVLFGPGVRAAPAAKPSAAFSQTNVQEAGVDEPDIVKTDGKVVFAIARGKLQAVDVREGRPRLVGSLPLGDTWGHELLAHGDRVLVLSRGAFPLERGLAGTSSSIRPRARPDNVILMEVDARKPSAMQVVRTVKIDGSFLSARRVGGSVRLVVASVAPRGLELVAPQRPDAAAIEEAVARNRATVEASTAANWLPSLVVENARTKTTTRRALVQCRHVRRPVRFSGFGLVTVLTLDLARGLRLVDSAAIFTDARIVYASPKSLYVATQARAILPLPSPPVAPGPTTELHKFDISSAARTRYRASGEVVGTLLNQWSLSEHKGVLRVVSTTGNDEQSFLTTLRPRDGALAKLGRVGNIGRRERVYGVRFIGDVGYVVTFRQVDPLHTLDLSDPERPRVVGELKIPGYSAYLHPVGENLLLGVGQDATGDGVVLGTQVSLFDVSNLRRPTRLYRRTLDAGRSEAEVDHRAFLYWPRKRLVVVPLDEVRDRRNGDYWFGGAVGFRVSRTRGIEEVGRVAHANGRSSFARRTSGVPVRRSLVVGDGLYTVSERGVRASDLDTFRSRGWAGFP